MLSPLAAASPIGLLVPLWGGVAPFYGAAPRLWGDSSVAMGQNRGYGVALSLLWGRVVAMGWRCPYRLFLLWAVASAMGQRCPRYGAEPWLWGGAVTAMGQSRGYGVALSLQ